MELRGEWGVGSGESKPASEGTPEDAGRRAVFPMSSHRLQVIYAGRVQGVGFRATAAHVARRLAVTGYVRNRPDGRVELVAEGHPAEIDKLLAAVAERMREHIDAVDRSAADATGEFDAFEVRH